MSWRHGCRSAPIPTLWCSSHELSLKHTHTTSWRALAKAAVTKNVLRCAAEVVAKVPRWSAQIGEIFERAVVKRVDASLGLVLSLPTANGAALPAFAHISALADTHIDKIGRVRLLH